MTGTGLRELAIHISTLLITTTWNRLNMTGTGLRVQVL